jgi:hypothetical protein
VEVKKRLITESEEYKKGTGLSGLSGQSNPIVMWEYKALGQKWCARLLVTIHGLQSFI